MPAGSSVRIAEQRQTQMDIDALAALGAAVELTLESSFLEDGSDRPGGESSLLIAAIEVGDLSADQIFRRQAISTYTLVATGNDSMKVSGEDRVLQLIQNAGWKIGWKTGLTRPRRVRASSAPGCGLPRALRLVESFDAIGILCCRLKGEPLCDVTAGSANFSS